jgi:hypothetical protein
MRNAERRNSSANQPAVNTLAWGTGERTALKGARCVREEAEGKGPQGTSLAAYFTSCPVLKTSSRREVGCLGGAPQ